LSRLPGNRARPVLRRRSNAPGLPDELFFSILQRRLIRSGEFSSVDDLAARVIAFINDYNKRAQPFRWTYDGRPLQAA
jgi:hypothetical protein